MLFAINRRQSVGMLAAIGSAVIVSGCSLFAPTVSYRFRMTVEVQTPEGIKRGYSVMQISESKELLMTSETHPVIAGLRGEAAVVSLPIGPLFVLPNIAGRGGPRLLNFVNEALNPLKSRAPTPDDYIRQVRELSAMKPGERKADLSREHWPKMIRFRNNRDFRTVEVVDPEEISVRRVTVEVTDNRVTSGVVEQLPSMGEGSGFGDWYDSLRLGDPRRLTLDDFRQGFT